MKYFYLFNNDIADRLAKTHRPLYLFLLKKWYFDEIYDFFIVKPLKSLGRKLWIVGDGKIIVSNLDQGLRIRTGELNEDAL